MLVLISTVLSTAALALDPEEGDWTEPAAEEAAPEAAAGCPSVRESPMVTWGYYGGVQVDVDGSEVLVKLEPVPYLNITKGAQGPRGVAMYDAIGGGDSELQAAFYGKGRPSDVAKALATVWNRWAELEKRSLVGPRSGDPAADLAGVYAKYLGLDCNGFAGTWAQVNGSALGPSSPVTDWAANSRASKQRTSLAAICPGDVIQYKNVGHVAVIAEVEPGRVYVVESCAETGCLGLQGEWHSIHHDGGGTFTIQQATRGRTDHPVYIAPVL